MSFAAASPLGGGSRAFTASVVASLALHAAIIAAFLALRPALEALGLEEHKSGHVTKPELRRMLDYATRYELDGFLKDHGVMDEFTMEDLEQDREDLRRFMSL